PVLPGIKPDDKNTSILLLFSMQITHLMSRVAIGGTFSPLHDGHKALLSRAHQLSSNGELIIGITSNEMARKRLRYVEEWEIRKQNLVKFMLEEFGASPKIVCLEDPFGPTIEEDFEYLVVSPETEPTGVLINARRAELRKEPIKVERVEYVLAYDRQPISSTRIMEHEIDIHGQLLQHR
ncbi:MAG TPA: phosphopantetheine adenylyltransferase, partial [archaeon]|nr:phosphopantetheine adenylyltransferase [archaeon]